MSYVIRCVCGQRMTVESRYAGREVLCVNCRQKLVVPAEPPEGSDEPVAVLAGAPGSGEHSGGPPSVEPSGSLTPPPGFPPTTTSGQPSYGRGNLKPHRGGTILALGIVSIVLCFSCCCSGVIAAVPGIIALVMGITDLKEIADGRMDPAGQGMTLGGTICGGIGILLALAGIGFGLAWMNAMPWRGHPNIWRGI